MDEMKTSTRIDHVYGFYFTTMESDGGCRKASLVSILHKSIAGRYRPVRLADGPITARYIFVKNASWELKPSSTPPPVIYYGQFQRGTFIMVLIVKCPIVFHLQMFFLLTIMH